ncbi:MAG: outer membrane protein assembly factor BamD [Bacteroidales bacterium]|jgi:outer membrane protein assembly factor BamD|nr:outer membrane protein assembly factor BamD [Bacteroidales bacterium]
MQKRTIILIILLLFTMDISSYAEKKPKHNKGRISKRYKTKEAKYEAAKTYYAKGAYLSAAQLFEEIYPLYVSSQEGENILFLFSDSYMKNHDYLMAAFHFKDYLRRYPQSPRAEDASFLASKCYFLNSPAYNLDQTDSYLAMEDLEIFLNAYPNSKFQEEGNMMMDSLRNKLAKKDFNIALMYYNTGNYLAAQISFNNLFKDYPSSSFTEEILYYLVKNSYEYAQKSVEGKKIERYQITIDNKNKLKAYNAESKFLSDAEKLADEAEKKRNKLLEK